LGIIFNNAALLVRAKLNHVKFDEILTIGHQDQYLSQSQIVRLAKFCGLTHDITGLSSQKHIDKFFTLFLDAKNVSSIDYSEYEGCTIIHDMNQPVDPKYYEKYDVVIDGGSLEHIFNFPVAVSNCMNMVKPGGSIFIFTMCNNHAGHGFYQFSPELFFRIFQPENGFKICDVIVEKHPYPGAELSPRTKCYSVTDPVVVRGRVGLKSRTPVMMMVHAKRTAVKPLFVASPIQSDYQSEYNKFTESSEQSANAKKSMRDVAKKIYKSLPLRVQYFLRGNYQRKSFSFSNRRFYKRWYPLKPISK